jgi:hypothetical protein
MSALKNKKQSENSQAPVVEVKKIKPYPFSIQILKEGQPPLRAKIHLLTELGVIIKIVGRHIYKVGDNINVEFDVPTTDQTIKDNMKIVKTYDNYDSLTNPQEVLEKIYTIELHFRNLNQPGKEAIRSFVKKIGQK